MKINYSIIFSKKILIKYIFNNLLMNIIKYTIEKIDLVINYTQQNFN